MSLLVFSIFDNVSEQSICIVMHNTLAEALREFRTMCERPEISNKAKDLTLIHIGEFNSHTLELTPHDNTVIGVGEEFVRSILVDNTDVDGEVVS